MNAEDLTTVDQLIKFLEGTRPAGFEVVGDMNTRYQWMPQTLLNLYYLSPDKPGQGVLIRYLMTISGYPWQQITRLARQYRNTGRNSPH